MQWLGGPEFKKTKVVAELARKAAATAPSQAGNWLTLGHALIALGDFAEAATALRQAAQHLPANAELRVLLASALTSLDLQEEALLHADAAMALAPDSARAKFTRLEILANLKRWDEVGDASEPGSHARLMQQHVKSLSGEDALALLDRQLSENPAHTNAIYLKAVALAALGHDAEAKALIALDRHLEVFELGAPAGYDTEQSFRDALAREIRANPTLLRDPKGKPLEGGLRTSRLSRPDAVAVEDLLARIREAIDRYIARLQALGDDFVRGRPRRAGLKSWAVIYGGEGRQKSHRHPGGWLSGVYFVSAPRPAAETAYRGPLVVGALDSDSGVSPPWGTREIEPVPGRLVLFPSYVPHATEPTGIDGARIIVAFDVVPVEEKDAGPRQLPSART